MTIPDVRAVVHAALSTVQGTTHHLGLVTLQVLTDRVAKAVAPLMVGEAEQAYDGELAMLRSLVRTLRVAVRPDEIDVDEVRRLVHEHALDDAASRETAHPTPTGAAFQAGLHDAANGVNPYHPTTGEDGRS